MGDEGWWSGVGGQGGFLVWGSPEADKSATRMADEYFVA